MTPVAGSVGSPRLKVSLLKAGALWPEWWSVQPSATSRQPALQEQARAVPVFQSLRRLSLSVPEWKQSWNWPGKGHAQEEGVWREG